MKTSDNIYTVSSANMTATAAATADKQNPSATNPKKPLFGIRHLQCLLCFFGLSIAYALRVNLSVAIVVMTDTQKPDSRLPEFDWDEKTKSLVLSSFFWGYVVTQIPAGTLAHKYGGKIMLFVGMLVCSGLAVLTPIFARIGNWQLVVALRVVQGFCQGVLFPSTHTIISKWSPVEERGSLTTYCYSGSQFGTFVMLALSGVLASSSMGWPSIFFFSGGVGIVWSAAWWIWGASSPADCSSISAEEKKLIENSLPANELTEPEQAQHLKTPWLKFMTSMPFIVIIIAHCAHNWGFWTLLTEIPSYMKNILNLDIKQNALLSSLPYFAMFLLCFVFSGISSFLSRSECMPLSTSRKVFNSIGHWIPAISLIGLAYVDQDETVLAIALLTITVGINAATYLGFQVNHIDLSPNFAGILMGITNCAANIMSLIAPLLVGFIVTDQHNPEQWRIVFFVASGFYFLGNLLFIIFGKTEVQPWNDPQTAQIQRSLSQRKRDNGQVESQH